MGWGDPGELVELNGASGKTWQLRFARKIWPRNDEPDASSTVYMMRENVPGGGMFIAKTQFADTDAEMEDLVSEAATWRKISVENRNQWPPNIVPLIDVFITRGDDPSVVFLMELCSAGNPQRNMPEDRALKVIMDVASGVQSIHNSGIPVHGYVVMANVMMTESGDAKLGGFGNGRAQILRSHPDLTSKDDVFAIGKLGFELIVGRPPQANETRLPPQSPVGSGLREAIDAALSSPQTRPDVGSFKSMLTGSGGGRAEANPLAGQSRQPGLVSASASMRKGLGDVVAQMSQRPPMGTRGKSTLLDAVNTQQSVRGGFPGMTGAPGPQSYATNTGAAFQSIGRRSSVLDAVATASTRGGDLKSLNGEGLSRRFSAMDPFGASSRPPLAPEKMRLVEEYVNKVTSPELSTYDAEALRKLLTQLMEDKTASEIFKVLFKRPISNDPVIAYKGVTCIHILMAEGSLEFLDMTLRQTKFLEWIEQSWSESSVQSNFEKHKLNFAFFHGEISKYAAFLRMKALFHYKTAYAYHGDWSRSNMLSESGEDPIRGRERKILSGLADIMEMAEEVAGVIISGNDPCRDVKILGFPILVGEIVHGYEAACELVDAIENLHTRKKLVPAFNRCHGSVKNVMDALRAAPDLASKVPQDIAAMEIDETPPDISAEPQREPEAEPIDLSYTDDTAPPVEPEPEPDAEEEEEKKKKKKKKKKKEKEAEDMPEVESVPLEGVEEAAPAEAEASGAVVPFQENKMGLLVRYTNEHNDEPEDETPVERAANPNVENAALLADILGESVEGAGGEEGGDGQTSWALALTDEAREEEKAAIREARESSAAYSMALTIVGEAPVFEKTHPAYCQCTMCQTATAVQNMTVYGVDDGSGDVEGAQVSNTAEMPEKFVVNPKDVKIGQQIGEGGFGSVYKGKYKRKEVAVKKVAKEFLRSDDVYDTLKKEVVLMCSLDHKNVLKLVGASTKRSNFMILVEYMTRGSLFDMIHKARARLNWPIVKRLAMNLAAGMSYLHASKVLHRDLKSGNIMVDEDFSVKIGDFGIAVVLSGDDAGLQEQHGFAGTFQYMAPEVIDKQPYTEKSDVYSFGIVLWEMVSMQLPFVGLDPHAAAQQVLHTGLRPQIPPFCPQPLAVLISSCWNQEPTMRPSFVQIQELLKRIPG